MLALYDPNNSLAPKIKKKLDEEDAININTFKELINLFRFELQNYSKVLIDSSSLNNNELNRITSFLKTQSQQSKVLFYDTNSPIISIINNKVFNDENHNKTESIDEVLIKLKQIAKVKSKYKHVVIGVSTGGPSTLEKVVPLFPKDIDVSIVIIQHILRGNYIYKICERLNSISQVNVKVAEHGEILKNGTVYFPPPGVHLYYKKENNGEVSIALSEEYNKRGESNIFNSNHRFVHIPSVDIGIESASDLYKDEMIAVILTGMGSDGAIALKYAKDNGAYTISEAESTSIIYGMPKAAVEKGGSMEVLKHYLIPGRILELLKYKK